MKIETSPRGPCGGSLPVMPLSPLTQLEAPLAYVEAYRGDIVDLAVPISDELNDNMGMNMAIIADRILGSGWMPDGFEQCEGYRIYRYKALGHELPGGGRG